MAALQQRLEETTAALEAAEVGAGRGDSEEREVWAACGGDVRRVLQQNRKLAEQLRTHAEVGC